MTRENMKPATLLLLLSVLFLFVFACDQRREPPPSNRDGVSNGTEKEEKSVPEEEKREEKRREREEEPAPEPDRNDDEYIPPAERSQLRDDEYTVVVGSFSRREMADQLSYELRMIRINNFVDKVNGKWDVCVGQYRSHGLAKNTLQRVRDKGYEQAEIVGPGRF